MTRPTPRFALVAPMHDEEGAVAALADEIAAACEPLGPFEAIFVDDGSTDATAARIAEAQARHPWLRALRHPRPCGQSAAVASGVRAARAPLICTLDGDGQNPPSETVRLLAPLLAPDRPADLGLVCGVRARRRDSWSRRAASRLANGLRRAVLRDGSPDTGCGLKAFDRNAFLALPYFDHMHRYLPSLFKRDGWRIMHLPVDHRPRATGRTKYGNLGRAMVGAADLFGVWWLMRRRRDPAACGAGPARGAVETRPETTGCADEPC